jgi:hypothetical protein
MWPIVRRLASKSYPDDEETAVLIALKVWLFFIQEPGQEHWRCPCAGLDDPILPPD